MINDGDDYEVLDVSDGWLVTGANLESEARVAVLDDLVDAFAADPAELGRGVLALDGADAQPGYWDVTEVGALGQGVVRQLPFHTHDASGTFGWHFRVDDGD